MLLAQADEEGATEEVAGQRGEQLLVSLGEEGQGGAEDGADLRGRAVCREGVILNVLELHFSF